MTRPHLSIVPKPAEDATAGEGPSLPIEGNLPLEIVWTLVPLVLVELDLDLLIFHQQKQS